MEEKMDHTVLFVGTMKENPYECSHVEILRIVAVLNVQIKKCRSFLNGRLRNLGR